MERFLRQNQFRLAVDQHLKAIESLLKEEKRFGNLTDTARLRRAKLIMMNVGAKADSFNQKDETFLKNFSDFRDSLDIFKTKKQLIELFNQFRSAI